MKRSSISCAATSFNGFDRSPGHEGKDPVALAGASLARRRGNRYDALLAAHLAEYQPLYRRVQLDLGHTGAEPVEAPNPAPSSGDVCAHRSAHPQLPGRSRPGAGQPALPVWPLPAHRLVAATHHPGQPPGHLERHDPAAVELELHDQHQHADELLAGRGRQPGRMPHCALRLHQESERQRRTDGPDQLRLSGLVLAPQRRCVVSICAGRQLRLAASRSGPTSPCRACGCAIICGSTTRSAATKTGCATSPGRSWPARPNFAWTG